MLPHKTFLFVRENKTGKIVQVFEFDPGMYEDKAEFYKCLSEEQNSIFALYPLEHYDISEGTGTDLTELVGRFPEFRGTETMEVLRDKITQVSHGVYKEYRIWYHVAEEDDDRVTIKATVSATKIPLSKMMRRLYSTGDEGKINSVQDLRIVAKTDEGKELYISASVSNGSAVLTIHLSPPVRIGDVRRVDVEYLWRGIWNQLRREGSDSGMEMMGRHAEYMEINIVLPRSLGDMEFKGRKPEIGIVREIRGEGEAGMTLTWQIEKATPGRYSYKIGRKA